MALSSAGLLILAFPNFNQPWCAWVALVPWLVLLRSLALSNGRVLRPRTGTPLKAGWPKGVPKAEGLRPAASPALQAFWWSWLVGCLFFLGSIWWLVHVTVFGWIVLCAYLALFFGVFGLCVSWFFTYHRPPTTYHLLVASVWVALEYARSHLFSGFGWNLLAYSQAPWRTVIQIADVTGAWGVSFLIVLVNAAVAAAIGGGRPRDRAAGVGVAAACLILALAYGAWRLPRITKKSQAVQVALVQGNIPQDEKWDATQVPHILARYEALTRAAASLQPDLIVWPETSVPAYFNADEEVTQRILELAKVVQRPLLVGAPMLQLDGGRLAMRNSAALVDPAGALATRHDKLHLVPYGEFIPFERAIPWLRDLMPTVGDFTAGHEFTVFRTPVASTNSSLITHHSSLSFGVLICFEDVFPELGRVFVERGAQLLLVITNDGWFGPTAAAYQHAQASALRAVELRVPVARAANTGWSGCIDALGTWDERVRDASGRELFVEGVVMCDVALSNTPGPYRQWGDWFAWLCVTSVILNVLIVSGLRQLTPSSDRHIMKG